MRRSIPQAVEYFPKGSREKPHKSESFEQTQGNPRSALTPVPRGSAKYTSYKCHTEPFPPVKLQSSSKRTESRGATRVSSEAESRPSDSCPWPRAGAGSLPTPAAQPPSRWDGSPCTPQSPSMPRAGTPSYPPYWQQAATAAINPAAAPRPELAQPRAGLGLLSPATQTTLVCSRELPQPSAFYLFRWVYKTIKTFWHMLSCRFLPL